MKDDVRTPPQNRSLHLWLERLADAMNDHGIDLACAMQLTADIPMTKENAKEVILRPIMHAMYPDVRSTRELTKEQLQLLYEVMNQWTSSRFGIHIPFPSEEELIHASRQTLQ